MECSISTLKHDIVSLVCHMYINYCSTSWLVCEWNVTLHDVDLIIGLKWCLKILKSMSIHIIMVFRYIVRTYIYIICPHRAADGLWFWHYSQYKLRANPIENKGHLLQPFKLILNRLFQMSCDVLCSSFFVVRLMRFMMRFMKYELHLCWSLSSQHLGPEKVFIHLNLMCQYNHILHIIMLLLKMLIFANLKKLFHHVIFLKTWQVD